MNHNPLLVTAIQQLIENIQEYETDVFSATKNNLTDDEAEVIALKLIENIDYSGRDLIRFLRNIRNKFEEDQVLQQDNDGWFYGSDEA